MKTILLIDDNPIIRKIITAQLKNHPYSILQAGSSSEGLSILENSEVDCVICDIKMKDSDGLQALQRIKKQYTNMPVIMLTGIIGEHFVHEARRLGADGFLIKPVRRETLMEVLDQAMDPAADQD